MNREHETMALRKNEQWYAVRLAPGAQRMARPLAVAADATEKERTDAQRRAGETIAERNLREAGIDVYMPAFWREIRAHRGGKIRARRLPLLVGYAFIRRDPGAGFNPVREVDGVINVVKVQGTPIALSEDDIRFLMLKMFDEEQAFRLQKAQKVEVARFKRRQSLHAELGRHLPKGRGRTVSLRIYADECLGNLADATRKRILGIISALDGLEQDSSLDQFREAV